MLRALDADIVARGPDGERVIPAEEFFIGVFETALGPGELITSIRIPVPRLAGTGWAYLKFVRPARGWATVGVAAVVGRRTARARARAWSRGRRRPRRS